MRFIKKVVLACLALSSLSLSLSAQTLSGISPRAFGSKSWREPVASQANLPLISNSLGDVRLVLDTDKLYVWSGSAWEEFTAGSAELTGPAGGDLTGEYPNPLIATNSVALGTDTTGGYAGSASEAGAATTAIALSADGTDCSAGQYARGVDASGNASGCTVASSGGVSAHSELTGLTSGDDHTQYAYLSGRSGGQSITGGTVSGDDLTLIGSSAGSGDINISTGSNIRVNNSGAGQASNQIGDNLGMGIRFGAGQTGLAAGFWRGDTAYLVCDANSNTCNLKGNGSLSWGSAESASATTIKIVAPTSGVISLEEPTVGGPGAIRIIRHEPSSLTISDNGSGGSTASTTHAPTTSYLDVTCSDSDGCELLISESGAWRGQTLIIAVVSGTLTVSDTSAITELSGSWTGGVNDMLSLIYGSDRWRETTRSNN